MTSDKCPTPFIVVINDVLGEIHRAESMFPDWPENHIEQAAIVCEEAGESIQAALNMRPGDPHQATIEDFRTELKQTAAMAIRALMHLPPPTQESK